MQKFEVPGWEEYLGKGGPAQRRGEEKGRIMGEGGQEGAVSGCKVNKIKLI